MNKIFSIFIALLLCLSLCACSGGETEGSDTSEILNEESTDVGDPSTDGPESPEEQANAGIGDNDKDNLVSVTDISAQ